jgi:hypothetical protein
MSTRMLLIRVFPLLPLLSLLPSKLWLLRGKKFLSENLAMFPTLRLFKRRRNRAKLLSIFKQMLVSKRSKNKALRWVL